MSDLHARLKGAARMCEIDGCGKSSQGRYCSMHASRKREAIGAAKMLDALADALTQKEPTP